jgi:pimeloyl-ACP methyl ester carboxylesterase
MLFSVPSYRFPSSRHVGDTLSQRNHLISKANRRNTIYPLSRELDLLTSVVTHFRRESLPWIEDLVFPLFPFLEGEGDGTQVDDMPLSESPFDLVEGNGRSKFASVYGTRIHYVDIVPEGWDSSSPVIIFLHGYNASLFSFRANVDDIATRTGLRVIAFDRPPFGLSDRPTSWGGEGDDLTFNPYEVQGGAKLANDFLETLHITSPRILVGHSAGALSSLYMHELAPEKVAGLVWVAPALPTKKEFSFQRRATFGAQMRIVFSRLLLNSDSTGLRYVRRMIEKQRRELLDGGLGYVPHPATSSKYGVLDEENMSEELLLAEAIDGYLLPLKTADWDKGALYNLRSFWLPTEYDYSLLKDDIPVFLVLGETDPLTASGKCLFEMLQEQRKGNDGAVTTCQVFQCGHNPMEEESLKFNDAVVEFISQKFVL